MSQVERCVKQEMKRAFEVRKTKVNLKRCATRPCWTMEAHLEKRMMSYEEKREGEEVSFEAEVPFE